MLDPAVQDWTAGLAVESVVDLAYVFLSLNIVFDPEFSLRVMRPSSLGAGE